MTAEHESFLSALGAANAPVPGPAGPAAAPQFTPPAINPPMPAAPAQPSPFAAAPAPAPAPLAPPSPWEQPGMTQAPQPAVAPQPAPTIGTSPNAAGQTPIPPFQAPAPPVALPTAPPQQAPPTQDPVALAFGAPAAHPPLHQPPAQQPFVPPTAPAPQAAPSAPEGDLVVVRKRNRRSKEQKARDEGYPLYVDCYPVQGIKDIEHFATRLERVRNMIQQTCKVAHYTEMGDKGLATFISALAYDFDQHVQVDSLYVNTNDGADVVAALPFLKGKAKIIVTSTK